MRSLIGILRGSFPSPLGGATAGMFSVFSPGASVARRLGRVPPGEPGGWAGLPGKEPPLRGKLGVSPGAPGNEPARGESGVWSGVRGKDEARLLGAMGKETANVHVGDSNAARAVQADLRGRPKSWLQDAARRMADAVIADAKAWRK